MLPSEEEEFQHLYTPAQLSLKSPFYLIILRKAPLEPFQRQALAPLPPSTKKSSDVVFSLKKQRAIFLFPSLRAENPELLDNPMLCNVNY